MGISTKGECLIIARMDLYVNSAILDRAFPKSLEIDLTDF